MSESRKHNPLKSTALPSDYLKIVSGIFDTNFDAGLKALDQLKKAKSHFFAHGRVYVDEVVLSISLMHKDHLAATTVHASSDFDPKASAPTIEDLLAACVDAVGAIYGQLLDPAKPERLEQIADESLSALEDVPFQWTPVKVEKHTIHLKVDKSNPMLDEMADDWLAKHDPEFKKRSHEEHAETEKLFVTGPKKPTPGTGNGTVH